MKESIRLHSRQTEFIERDEGAVFAPSRAGLLLPPSSLARNARPAATSLSLLATDLIAVLLARSIALLIWHLVNPNVGYGQDFDLLIATALFPVAYASFGLYGAKGLSPVEEMRRLILGSIMVSLVLTAATFFSKAAGVYSRGALVSSLILTSIIVPLARALLRATCAHRPWWGVPVLILGAGDTAKVVVQSLREQAHVGFKPVACLDDDERKHGECAGIPVAGSLEMAPSIAKRLKISHVLIAMPRLERSELVRIVERWGATFSHVIVIPDLFGIATLWVSARDLGSVLGLEVRQNLLIPLNRWLKRALDLIMSVVFGILALPVIAVASLWIKLVSNGPAFYTQEREGEGGRIIRIHKLRTMFPKAEKLLLHHLANSPEAREEWRACCKLKDDPRILPGIGRLLRRSSLDELPQIWNVFLGEMSMVGPRPFPTYHLEMFETEFRELRTRVRPGLTGLWQVSSRSDGDLKMQESLDVYYIRNWSLWLDLHILARTVRAVLFPKGAY